MKKIIQSALMIGLFSVSLTSCLKDKENEAGKIGLQDPEKVGIKIVEILNADHGPVTYALNTAPATEKIPVITVNLATGQTAQEDIKVTLAKNISMIANYNTANTTNYIELPANCYTLPADGLVVTIPKGSNSASLDLNLIKGNFDFTQAYAVAYNIASVSPSGYTISGNFNKLMSTVGLKNKYDGVYELTLTQSGWGAFAVADGATAVFPAAVELQTAGADDVTISQLAPSPFGNLQPGWAGSGTTISGYTSFGATTPRYRFNSSTNKLASVTNTTAPDARVRTLYLDAASTTSQFNPTTRAIRAEYFMTQLGRPDQKFVMDFRYLRSR